ncbi:MAG: ABC transporter permease subunit [Deltaproteobacteria bacterium]|nr:ABC transporter permease subunit [Deltaproteobacteria bacterium]
MMPFPGSAILKQQMDDFRHILRRPSLLFVTAVSVLLIFLFIVFPIGSVLIKSFTVSYPTVTITFPAVNPTGVETEKRATDSLRVIFKEIQGIEQTRFKKENGAAVHTVRFRKDWDDLKGFNDVKRAIKRNKDTLEPLVLGAKLSLGKEVTASLATYMDFFSGGRYYRALKNSIVVAIVTTLLVIPLAFCFAFLGLNGPALLKIPLRLLGLIPLVAPPFIFSLALIIIGGRHGILTRMLELPFNIYGWRGVIIAQVITFLPLGYLMIENVLCSLGSNLEEAACDMRATDWQILCKITIPLAAPGILKASLLVFILSIADFGNPMLIGGDVPFLSTGAYLLWVSDNNLEMAAVFCVFLVLPSLIIFVVNEYLLKGKGYTTIGGKPQQTERRPIAPNILYPMLGLAAIASAVILVSFGIIFFGAFTKILMVDNTLTLEHFRRPNGFRTLITSLKFSLGAALVAPAVGITLSYILVRKRVPLKKVLESLALLGFAVPGTVMGIGYILAFNHPPLQLTGTFIILIINEAFRNLSVSLEAGVSKLHQIDVAIEEAAADMGAGAVRTFFKIVLPLISSAYVAGFIYTFMVGMIAVSAVIFLITPGNDLAALYILNVAEQGYLGMACAISTMLIAVVLACLGGLKFLVKMTKIEMY